MILSLVVYPPEAPVNRLPGFVVEVPQSYVSNSLLSDSATYNGSTFSSLGVTTGTYEFTWGRGVNQNFTLQIGAAAVPDLGSTFGLFLLSFVALIGANRVRSLRLGLTSRHQAVSTRSNAFQNLMKAVAETEQTTVFSDMH